MARAVSEDGHKPAAVLTGKDVLDLQNLVKKVHVAEKIRRYIANVVIATRDPVSAGIPDLKALIEVGASPRASISLEKAARAQATGALSRRRAAPLSVAGESASYTTPE